MMRMDAKKKIQSSRGMSLAETLLAVMILLMVAAIMASGIPAARNAYEKIVLSSNAEVLLSTTISTLRNELSCSQIDQSNGQYAELTYYNPRRESASRIYKDTNQTLVIQQSYGSSMINAYDPENDPDADNKNAGRIFQKLPTEELYVSYASVSVDKVGGIITFKDLAVILQSNETPLAGPRDISFRIVSR